MTDKVDVEPTFNEVHERLEKQHGIHWTQQVDVEPVAYHYCYTNAFGHPVWNVGFHIPSEATEWHDLVHASALAALQAENEKLKAAHIEMFNAAVEQTQHLWSAQAENKRMREALEKIKHHFDTDEYAWEVATTALKGSV